MATYYTKSVATGGGTGSLASPFTLQEAFDTAVAGDEIRIVADGTYLPTSRIDLDTNSGTYLLPIKIRGANTSGDVDGTVATISGASLTAQDIFYNITADVDYLDWRYIRMTASPQSALEVDKNCRNWNVEDCEFDNHGDYAFQTDLFMTGSRFINCVFRNNTGGAFTGIRVGSIVFRGCTFANNGNTTFAFINANGNMDFRQCLFYHAAGSEQKAMEATSLGEMGGLVVDGCIFFRCSDAISNIGTGAAVTTRPVILNSVFSNCSGTGILWTNANEPYPIVKNCLFYLNSTAHYTSGIVPIDSIEDSDPLFTNTTAGSEDFRPQAGSPLLGAGLSVPTGA